MRQLIKSYQFEVTKTTFGSIGHKWWATDTVYLENKTTRPDDEALDLYNKKCGVYNDSGNDSGDISDKYDIKVLSSKLFMAENDFKLSSYVESISCFGETVNVVVIEDYHWPKSEIHQMRTKLAQLTQRVQFLKSEEQQLAQNSKPFWEIHDKFNDASDVREPSDEQSGNLMRYTLPLIRKHFPTLHTENLVGVVPTLCTKFANRYVRRHRKRK